MIKIDTLIELRYYRCTTKLWNWEFRIIYFSFKTVCLTNKQLRNVFNNIAVCTIKIFINADLLFAAQSCIYVSPVAFQNFSPHVQGQEARAF